MQEEKIWWYLENFKIKILQKFKYAIVIFFLSMIHEIMLEKRAKIV